MKMKGFFGGGTGVLIIACILLWGCDTQTTVKSSNTQLKLLGVKYNDLELPCVFDASTAVYKITVPHAAKNIYMYAELEDENAVIVSPSNAEAELITLDVGLNSFALAVKAEDGTIKDYVIEITRAASDEKVIVSFKIGDASGIISGDSIVVTLPFGADLTRLTPEISFTGSSLSPKSGEARDFSNPLTYTVTAADGSTRNYLAAVGNAPSSAKEITSFTIGGGSSAIYGDGIVVTLPFGTDLTRLTPEISFTGSSLSPKSGEARDFSNPLTYTVTAADDSTRDYIVVARHAASASKELTSFKIGNAFGIIEGNDVHVTVPFGTNLANLSPAIGYNGSSLNPKSGEERDFSGPVTYTVTAGDGSTRVYTVTVTANAQGTITINFDAPQDESIDITRDTEKSLSRKAKDRLQITVAGELIMWFIDSKLLPGTAGLITLSAADYPIGVHFISVVVRKDGVPYSKELSFKVVE